MSVPRWFASAFWHLDWMQKFKSIALLLGWLLALAPSVLLSLLLMPIIPDLQKADTLELSYRLYQWEYGFLAIGFGLMLFVGVRTWKQSRWLFRTFLVLAAASSIALIVFARMEMSAESMFNEPTVVQRSTLRVADVLDADTSVYLWVRHGNVVAGYGLDLIAHHHKVLDTVGGQSILVTYCTMCHTGRVYVPIVGGAVERFRLVGASYFNAVFEDVTTGSWWYQATGECVIGPRKGMELPSVPFLQGTVAEMNDQWHPEIVSIFTPDAATGTRSEWARGYAARAGDTSLALTPRSLVIGVECNGKSKAYPVMSLMQSASNPVTDTVGGWVVQIPKPRHPRELVVVYRDSISSGSTVASVVDYWHAWRTFHPNTAVWKQQ